jgi:hypothetical protein
MHMATLQSYIYIILYEKLVENAESRNKTLRPRTITHERPRGGVGRNNDRGDRQ